MAFGTTLPTSTPENRMMAQTMPTIAPAQRVVAPDSSSRMQAFIDSEPPNPPNTAASRLARPFERNSWSRSAVFCRATSRLVTSSKSAIAITPQNEPISAPLWAMTPQSTCSRMTALMGSHRLSSPRLGKNQVLRTASSFTNPNKLPSKADEKAEESERKGEVGGDKAAENRN